MDHPSPAAPQTAESVVSLVDAVEASASLGHDPSNWSSAMHSSCHDVSVAGKHLQDARSPMEKGHHRSPETNHTSGRKPHPPQTVTPIKHTQAGKSQNKSVQWVRVCRESVPHQHSTEDSKINLKPESKDTVMPSFPSSTEGTHQQSVSDNLASNDHVLTDTMGLLSQVTSAQKKSVQESDSSCNPGQECCELEEVLNEGSKDQPPDASVSKGPEEHQPQVLLMTNVEVIDDHNFSCIHSQSIEENDMQNGGSQDIQSIEQQKSLSRTSSLNAKAREFVPRESITKTTVSNAVSTPSMIPLGSSPGILSAFAPTSPIQSSQLAGFPIPVPGPPPQIPVPLMGAMPLLGHSHPGFMNLQMSGTVHQQSMLPASFVVHSASNIPTHPISTDPSAVDFANHSVGTEVEIVQDQRSQQDADAATTQSASSKHALTEELTAKIVKQVEFYFSDANLPTDYHLMKFVKKDPEGFVPVSVVANFRKIRSLLKNHALVAVALRSSKELVVSEDGKKVRRLHPLPHIDLEEIQSRTVVAENLPEDHSIESMEKLFGAVGTVIMVRVCEPEATNGNPNMGKFLKADMVVSNKLHALVEFESIEQAEKAVSTLNDQGNWRSGLHVRLLLRRTFQNKHGHQVPASSKSLKATEGADGSGGEEDLPPVNENLVDKGVDENHLIEEHIGSDHVQHIEKDGASKRGRGRGRGRGRVRGQFHSNGGRNQSVGTPPQGATLLTTETKPPPGPRMPDGTKGFSFGRGRSLTS